MLYIELGQWTRFRAFMKERRYLETGDDVLRARCEARRLAERISTGVFAIATVAFLVRILGGP